LAAFDKFFQEPSTNSNSTGDEDESDEAKADDNNLAAQADKVIDLSEDSATN